MAATPVRLHCAIPNVAMGIVQDPINVPAIVDMLALIAIHLSVTLHVKMEEPARVQIIASVELNTRVQTAVNLSVTLLA